MNSLGSREGLKKKQDPPGGGSTTKQKHHKKAGGHDLNFDIRSAGSVREKLGSSMGGGDAPLSIEDKLTGESKKGSQGISERVI